MACGHACLLIYAGACASAVATPVATPVPAMYRRSLAGTSVLWASYICPVICTLIVWQPRCIVARTYACFCLYTIIYTIEPRSAALHYRALRNPDTMEPPTTVPATTVPATTVSTSTTSCPAALAASTTPGLPGKRYTVILYCVAAWQAWTLAQA